MSVFLLLNVGVVSPGNWFNNFSQQDSSCTDAKPNNLMLDPLASTDENDFGLINLLFATSSNSPDCRRKSTPSIGVITSA